MENEELEFASKEDLAVINTNPELQKVHRAMLAGVQKKFQTFNAETQTLKKSIETLTNQVQELDGGLMEWENWFAANKDVISRTANNNIEGDLTKGKGKGKEKAIEGDDDRFNQLVEAINRGATQFESKLTHMNRMLNLSMQLNELYRTNPKLDASKVLDVALKKGYTDLNRAYEDDDAYGKELMAERVETALKPRLEEERLKRDTNIESGSGAVPLNFELPKELPKSFTDAGQQFLSEREAESKKV